MQFRFRGKSGKFRQVQFRDLCLAKIVSQCQDTFEVCAAVQFRRTRWPSKYEQALLHLLRRLDGSQGAKPAPRRVAWHPPLDDASHLNVVARRQPNA